MKKLLLGSMLLLGACEPLENQQACGAACGRGRLALYRETISSTTNGCVPSTTERVCQCVDGLADAGVPGEAVDAGVELDAGTKAEADFVPGEVQR